MQKFVKVLQGGKLSYSNGLKLQNALVERHHDSNRVANTLVCLEHYPVYTTGLRTKQYTEAEETRLKNIGAEFYRTNRGGLITFHGPGQLILYPIINLKEFKSGMRWYVCHLEKTIIRVCKKFGLQAETSPHTGVWINDKKVCAIGVHGSRYITSHGLALNCNVDLNWFKHIVPCGIEGKGVTSLSSELQRNMEVEEVLPVVIESFSEVFKCAYTNFSETEAGDLFKSIAVDS